MWDLNQTSTTQIPTSTRKAILKTITIETTSAENFGLWRVRNIILRFVTILKISSEVKQGSSILRFFKIKIENLTKQI